MRRAPDPGYVEAIIGCMMAGKTTELIRRIERETIAGYDCQLYKPTVDDRYDEQQVVGHNGTEREATPIDTATMALDYESQPDVVAFDEFQFFEPGPFIETIDQLRADGVRVIAAGLDLDFRGEPFPTARAFVPRADYVDKLRAICAVCGNPASRSQRLINGEPAPADSQRVLVGADDTYEPRCPHHHVVPDS